MNQNLEVKKDIWFLSWSGDLSSSIACTFRTFLLRIIPEKETFISQYDIGPGLHWYNEINDTMKSCKSGLIFLTRDNIDRPWIGYESSINTAVPILIDIGFDILKNHPLGQRQGITLYDTANRKVRIWELINQTFELNKENGINDKHLESIKTRYEEECVRFFKNLDQIIDAYNTKVFPNKYFDKIKYNMNINSCNFVMPSVFKNYESSLFFAGINLSFVLNIVENEDNFITMIDSLVKDKKKTIKFLISDVWVDEDIKNAYLKMDVGTAMKNTLDDLTSSLVDQQSSYYISKVIEKHFSIGDLEEIIQNKRLIIRTINQLPDTFWFVDPKEASGTGMFMLQTGTRGNDRPVFYFSRKENNELFEYYYSLCSIGFEQLGRNLLPT